MRKFILNRKQVSEMVGEIILYWLMDANSESGVYLCHPVKVIKVTEIENNQLAVDLVSLKTNDAILLVIPENGILIQQEENQVKFVKFLSPIGSQLSIDKRFMESEESEKEMSKLESYGLECVRLHKMSLSPLSSISVSSDEVFNKVLSKENKEKTLTKRILFAKLKSEEMEVDENSFRIKDVEIPTNSVRFMPDGYGCSVGFFTNYGIGISKNGLILLLDEEVDPMKIKDVLVEYNSFMHD